LESNLRKGKAILDETQNTTSIAPIPIIVDRINVEIPTSLKIEATSSSGNPELSRDDSIVVWAL